MAREVPALSRFLAFLGIVAFIWILANVSMLALRAPIPDFEYFYKAGAWLYHNGGLDPGFDRRPDGSVQFRGTIEWYWPFVSRLMSLIAWLPYETAGRIWLCCNIVALVALVRLIGRELLSLPPRNWPVTMLLPLVLLPVFFYWEFRLNQINILTMLLLVGSLVSWKRGRAGAAGLWLGLAVLLKLTPGLFILWYSLKRQYRTVATALVTVILAGPVSDAIVFGPQYTADLYRDWARAAVTEGSHRALILEQREMDWRNQSISAVLSRWLHPTNYSTHFDNDPRIIMGYRPRTVNLVDLEPGTIALIVTGLAAASLALLIWIGRHPAASLTPARLHAEWALFMLAMLWLMPVMRRYHLIWELPAIAVLGAALVRFGWRDRLSHAALAGIVGVVACQAALLAKPLTDHNILEAMGVLLASVVCLAIPLIILLYRLAPKRVSHTVFPSFATPAGAGSA